MSMNKYRKEFTFELEQPILVSTNEGDKECTTLVLSAPSNKQYPDITALRQVVMQAINELRKMQGGDNDEDDNGEKKELGIDGFRDMVLYSLSSCENGLIKAMKLFEKLICGKNCMMSGKYESTEDLLEQIDFNELEQLMGEYIANFILPSWMKKATNKAITK